MKNICSTGLILRLKQRFRSGEPQDKLSDGALTQEQLLAHMECITSAQRQIHTELELLRRETAALEESVRRNTMYPGMVMLCELWSVMKCSGTPENLEYADTLFQAMTAMGAEPIYPRDGESYDPSKHRKLIGQQRGTTISTCADCDIGWKFGNQILRKAIVQLFEE